jgi:hypothetical protein
MSEPGNIESRYSIEICDDLEKWLDDLSEQPVENLKNVFIKVVISIGDDEVEVLEVPEDSGVSNALATKYGKRLAGIKFDIDGNTYTRIGYKEFPESKFLKHRQIEDSKKDFIKKLFKIIN